ncbi:MAG: response regulator transcription factor [Alphaproteobacteria bacterium]|nr:response regulator transcription factor [Alphaproteobacteria bacterium]
MVEAARPSALGVDGEQARHILVVDDDDRLRKLLARYLGDKGYRVTGAKDATDARAKLAGMAFDLIVVDVMMPGESGIELTRAVRGTLDLPILMLTAMGEPDDRIAGLEAGVDDYLAKPFEPRELVLRIATILRRAAPRSHDAVPIASPLQLGTLRFDRGRNLLLDGDVPVRLTTAETSLLRIFAAAPGRTLGRDALCQEIGADPTGRALDVQIIRLRRKIEANPKEPRYLVTIWGEGYALHPDPVV